ncbi:glycosyltransferase [Isoptericola variabilis]|uniref:D-inositol 3-phosphate glycosyltransferase n=1 Tax=Isoptericola variabilis (strain 225) TaxID=743718 RepID=F6FUM7_ISOV2|nr:glycosyltransferase [Isoptericola variabilis]AEG45454.1 glycosyl transferase group 1 [Isoptericola variabilis 225]TWH31523.1 alpha-1,6-mannosyltransferase [Isoptericola variabilis J7]
MRIVHVANFYGPRSGGIRTAMHAIAREYVARGHEPVLVVPDAGATTAVTGGVRVVTVPAPLVPGIGGYRVVTRPGAVRRLLDELEPDRLEVSDRTTLVGTGDWARAAGVPSLLMLHERVDGLLRAFWPGAGKGARPRGGTGVVGSAVAPVVADRWNAATFRRFDRLVATTGFAAAEASRLGERLAGSVGSGVPGAVPPLHRVPLGVDLDLFSPARHDAGTRAGLAPPGTAVVLVVSRLSGEKRVDLAIDAVARVVRDGRPARLVVAGGGPQLTRLRARAERHGLDHRFLGFVPDRTRLATLLACADVVVAPGPIETFGLAALEALASGTPVVCSATSALPEVVGGAGAVGAPDPHALALAVHDVLDRPAAARREAARERAELFPWSATGEAMLRIHGAPSGVPAGVGGTR